MNVRGELAHALAGALVVDQHAVDALADEVAQQAQRQRQVLVHERARRARRAPSVDSTSHSLRRNSMSARSASAVAPSAAVRTM